MLELVKSLLTEPSPPVLHSPLKEFFVVVKVKQGNMWAGPELSGIKGGYCSCRGPTLLSRSCADLTLEMMRQGPRKLKELPAYHLPMSKKTQTFSFLRLCFPLSNYFYLCVFITFL